MVYVYERVGAHSVNVRREPAVAYSVCSIGRAAKARGHIAVKQASRQSKLSELLLNYLLLPVTLASEN